MSLRQPTFFIPHGGGPCFFMPDPRQTWTGMGQFLRSLPSRLPQPPSAILVVSAHWEAEGFNLLERSAPPLIYDYYGFPPATYEIEYQAPGAPALAASAATLLKAAGLPVRTDPDRGFDHGVFIPMKVAFPEASIPVLEMSVDRSMDPALHLAAGRALAPLRDENVLIIGSGMSFHDLRGFGNARATRPSLEFDAWLRSALSEPVDARSKRLTRWAEAPGARECHPTAEHLIPLMVAAGAASGPAFKIYKERVMQVVISGYRFE